MPQFKLNAKTNRAIVDDTRYISEMVVAYITAAYWADTGDIDQPDADTPASVEFRTAAIEDCTAFYYECGAILKAIAGLSTPYGADQAGHDLWLTRNGHGVGFWDRGLGPVGDRLTKSAEGMGERYLHEGDDGLLYVD